MAAPRPTPASIRGLPAGLLALLCIPLLLSACSYSTKRLTDFPSARTIAVLPFENLGYRRDLELRLSQAVAADIRARSSLGFATAETADLILSGKMYAHETPVVLNDEGGIIQKRLEGWLEIEVRERVSGRVVRRAKVAATADWRPGVYGESLPGSANDEWIRRLAEQVAQNLERGF